MGSAEEVEEGRDMNGRGRRRWGNDAGMWRPEVSDRHIPSLPRPVPIRHAPRPRDLTLLRAAAQVVRIVRRVDEARGIRSCLLWDRSESLKRKGAAPAAGVRGWTRRCCWWRRGAWRRLPPRRSSGGGGGRRSGGGSSEEGVEGGCAPPCRPGS